MTLNVATYRAPVNSISAGQHRNGLIAGERDTVYGSEEGWGSSPSERATVMSQDIGMVPNPKTEQTSTAGCRSCSTPSHRVERNDGKTGSRRALRACAGSRRGRCGHPVLQAPVLGTADSEHRDCTGVRGVLFQVPEASMSAAAAMRLTRFTASPGLKFPSLHSSQPLRKGAYAASPP